MSASEDRARLVSPLRERPDGLGPSARALLTFIEEQCRAGFTGTVEIEFNEGGVRDLRVTTRPLLAGASRMVRRNGD